MFLTSMLYTSSEAHN